MVHTNRAEYAFAIAVPRSPVWFSTRTLSPVIHGLADRAVSADDLPVDGDPLCPGHQHDVRPAGAGGDELLQQPAEHQQSRNRLAGEPE
jgi:hypothetical protein